MPGESRKRFLNLPISLGIGALILFSLARPLDTWLAGWLAGILGITAFQSTTAGNLIAGAINTVMYVLYASSGFVCARFLHGSARAIALVQLVALTALLVFPFHNIMIPALEPISYIASGMLGLTLGLLAAALNEALDRAHVQQVESTLRSRQLMETRLQLVKQDEIERKMLAADLHDQVLNDLKLLLRLIEQEKNKLGQDLLSKLNSRIELAMDSIRKVMESLCPSDLEHIGLLAALEECLKDRSEKHDFLAQFRCSIQEEDLQALSKIEKALLYRLAQESITNICKHAQASRVRLTAEIQDEELAIKITDDGVGLKTPASSKSRGLQYMRLRGEIVGARISWNPGPDGKGTCVEVRVNLRGRESGESIDS